MKKVLATLAIAGLTAWAAPASAGVIATHGGNTLSQANPFFEVHVDLDDILGAKLSFKTDGSGGIDPCDGSSKQDCFWVEANGAEIDGLQPQPLSVSSAVTMWSTPIGIDDEFVILRFSATFSHHSESIAVSNIKVKTVSEPASLALFGLGLAGLGFIRRRRSI